MGLAFTADRIDLYRAVNAGELVRETLPVASGAIRPSAREPNLDAPGELAQRCQTAFVEMTSLGTRAAMLLPDLAVTAAVVERAQASRDLALVSGLSEDRLWIDTWAPPGGGTLGVAIPGAVLSQYEAVRDALGLEPGWVDTQSGALLPRLSALPEHQSSVSSAEIQLFSTHYSLALFRHGKLVDYRRRLVNDAEPMAPIEELNRQRQHLGEPRMGFVGISGANANEIAHRAATYADLDECRPRFDGEEELAAQAVSDLLGRA